MRGIPAIGHFHSCEGISLEEGFLYAQVRPGNVYSNNKDVGE